MRNISYFSYNQNLNVGIVLEYLPESGLSELIHMFHFGQNYIDYRQEYGRGQISEEQRTLKTVLSSEHILFTLTADNAIRVYQLGKSIQLIQEYRY